MKNTDKIILKIWGGIIGALICGLPAYVFLLDPEIYYFVPVTAGIGTILGISIIIVGLKLIDKTIKSFLYHALTGFLIGLLGGICWILITGISTKWWEGWAFVIGLAVCIFSGILGLMGGIIGRWKIARILEGRSRLYGDKYSLSIIIGVLIFLFMIFPFISRG